MFKIKRRYVIAAVAAAALMLTGCGDKETDSAVFIFTSSSGQSNSVQSGQSPVTLPQGSAENPPQSVPAVSGEQPVSETNTFVYNHDPLNESTITFDGQSVIVKGVRGDLLDGVQGSLPSMNIEQTSDGEERTYILTPENGDMAWDYGSFVILDNNGHQSTINIRSQNGRITLPDVSEIVRGNRSAADSAAVLSPGQTLQYITLDGSADNAARIWQEITDISNGICEGIDSDYDKLRAISRWVSDNIYYDNPIHSEGAPRYCLSLEYMLNNRSSICGGYSNMTSALCAVQGIRCLNVSGMAINYGMCFQQGTDGEFHEWNVAEIDGRRIIIDTGWNSYNYFNYDKTYSMGTSRSKYFDIGEEIFALDHKAQKAEYRDYSAAIQ